MTINFQIEKGEGQMNLDKEVEISNENQKKKIRKTRFDNEIHLTEKEKTFSKCCQGLKQCLRLRWDESALKNWIELMPTDNCPRSSAIYWSGPKHESSN